MPPPSISSPYFILSIFLPPAINSSYDDHLLVNATRTKERKKGKTIPSFKPKPDQHPTPWVHPIPESTTLAPTQTFHILPPYQPLLKFPAPDQHPKFCWLDPSNTQTSSTLLHESFFVFFTQLASKVLWFHPKNSSRSTYSFSSSSLTAPSLLPDQTLLKTSQKRNERKNTEKKQQKKRNSKQRKGCLILFGSP